MKIGILISARNKSKRLKNKLFLKVSNISIIDFLIKRSKNLEKYAKIILSTSYDRRDIKLVNIAKKNNINYYIGHKEDKLKRYYQTALKYNLDAVIIIDGDDPLFFKNLIKNQIILFKKKMYDMIYYKTKHVGISCYLIKTSILKKIINKKNKRNTEVWAHYFLKQKKINKKMINFNLKYFKDPLRLTLDYKEDFKLIKKIINFLDNKTDFSDKNLIQSLRYNKELLNINSGMVKKWEKHLKLST